MKAAHWIFVSSAEAGGPWLQEGDPEGCIISSRGQAAVKLLPSSQSSR